MRLIDTSPFKTSVFRLTTLYVVLFSLSVGIIFGIVWYATKSSMRAQLAAAVQLEAITLAEEYSATGGSRAAGMIEQRLRRGTLAYFLVQDGSGRLIAGNIAPTQPKTGLFDLNVHRDANTPQSGGGEVEEAREAIGYGIRLADGSFILVADDAERIAQVETAIQEAVAMSAGVSILLAILGGLALSSGFLRRIEVVNRTSREIMSGHFDARIPTFDRNDELDRLARNLNAMFDRVQKLMESLKQMSSDVAHDLRTPLSRLRQTLELARKTATSVEEFRVSTDAAIKEAEDLLETFAALLRIAQIESGSRKAGFAQVDLSALFQLVSETYEAVAEDAGHQLVAHIEPHVSIVGDRELLLQLSANLVENAIRHTPEGSKVELELRREPRGIVAIFADNGPSIPIAEREKVFRRFYRLEASRTTSGSGLGLALVASVAELHDARITLGDRGPGLTVEVWFPDTVGPSLPGLP